MFFTCWLISLYKKRGSRPFRGKRVIQRKSSSKIHNLYSYMPDKKLVMKQLSIVNAENAFNTINTTSQYQIFISIVSTNISIISYVRLQLRCNCYLRLFIIGGKEINLQEGMSQGDPTTMAI